MSEGTLLISVRPRYSELIFDGTKTVELRRTRPRLCPGDHVFVYVSSPIKRLTGVLEVAGVVADKPAKLWRRIGSGAAVSKAIFLTYFEGAKIGFGICIKRAWTMSQPQSLDEVRRAIPRFQPPQIYRYLTADELALLGFVPSAYRRAA